MQLLNIIWPAHTKAQPNLFGRLGRVAHWLALLLAVAIAAMGLPPSIQSGQSSSIWIICLMIGGFYFAGRGLRYVLAGE